MQARTIIALIAFAITASAAPSASPWDQDQQQPSKVTTCQNNQVAACCDSIINQWGANCKSKDSTVDGTCGGNQQLGCCETGDQEGLVNVGSVCPNILIGDLELPLGL